MGTDARTEPTGTDEVLRQIGITSADAALEMMAGSGLVLSAGRKLVQVVNGRLEEQMH